MGKKGQAIWKEAIDSVKGPLNQYKKIITVILNDMQEKISFESKVYKRLKRITYKKVDNPLDEKEEDHFYLKDLESWDIFDIIRYNKKEIQDMVRQFLESNNLDSIDKRIKAIRLSDKFIESHKFSF